MEQSLFGKALHRLKDRAAAERDLANLSLTDIRLLATDIGITEADLREIAPSAANHPDLMDRMMRARGLDPDAMRQALADVVRDMEVTCARCRNARTCRRVLDAGITGDYEFCGNAAVIETLITRET